MSECLRPFLTGPNPRFENQIVDPTRTVLRINRPILGWRSRVGRVCEPWLEVCRPCWTNLGRIWHSFEQKGENACKFFIENKNSSKFYHVLSLRGRHRHICLRFQRSRSKVGSALLRQQTPICDLAERFGVCIRTRDYGLQTRSPISGSVRIDDLVCEPMVRPG